jgi:biopolymer transport protein ExbD
VQIARKPVTPPRAPLAAMSDIAFQLIIFFMVTATFVNKDAVKVELPNSESEQRHETDEMVTLQANAEVTLLDGEQIDDPALLTQRLEQALAGRPEDQRIVVMLTADDLPFQKSTELMAAIQRAGGTVAVMMEAAAE